MGSIGKIGGYCCVYDVIDTYQTIWDRGVFFGAEQSVESGIKMPMFYAHNTQGRVPVGGCSVLRSDDVGLYFEGDIYDNDVGYTLLQAVADGTVTGTSFTFRSLEEYSRGIGDKKIVHFKRAEMREISPVVWPGIRETTCEVLECERLEIARECSAERLNAFRATVIDRQVQTRAALEMITTLNEELKHG